jgi:hypothetical protein
MRWLIAAFGIGVGEVHGFVLSVIKSLYGVILLHIWTNGKPYQYELFSLTLSDKQQQASSICANFAHIEFRPRFYLDQFNAIKH